MEQSRETGVDRAKRLWSGLGLPGAPPLEGPSAQGDLCAEKSKAELMAIRVRLGNIAKTALLTENADLFALFGVKRSPPLLKQHDDEMPDVDYLAIQRFVRGVASATEAALVAKSRVYRPWWLAIRLVETFEFEMRPKSDSEHEGSEPA